MRLLQIFMTICLLGLMVTACTNHKQQNEPGNEQQENETKKTAGPEDVFRIEMTSSIEQVMDELKRLGFQTRLQEADRSTIAEIASKEILDEPVEASFTFKEDGTFMELFSMYDLYRHEYEEIRNHYYQNKFQLDDLDAFYELPLEKQQEIDHKLAEYVDKDERWNQLKKAYESIEQDFSDEVFHYASPLFMRGEFTFTEPVDAPTREQINEQLTELFGRKQQVVASSRLNIWETKTSVILSDCTNVLDVEEDMTQCKVYMLPSAHYMNEYLELQMDIS